MIYDCGVKLSRMWVWCEDVVGGGCSSVEIVWVMVVRNRGGRGGERGEARGVDV